MGKATAMQEPVELEPAARPSPASGRGEFVDGLEAAWRRGLKVQGEAVRAFRDNNADFASRLMDLNLEAARQARPLEFGAAALELYFGYLGRSAALAQQAIVMPWLDKGGAAD